MKLPYGHDGRKCPKCGELMYLGFSNYSCDCKPNKPIYTPTYVFQIEFNTLTGGQVYTYYPMKDFGSSNLNRCDLLLSWNVVIETRIARCRHYPSYAGLVFDGSSYRVLQCPSVKAASSMNILFLTADYQDSVYV